MADVAQEFGLARAWHTVSQHAGEREVIMALAMILPIGALVLGFCRGKAYTDASCLPHFYRSLRFFRMTPPYRGCDIKLYKV